jgi:hypothetical protein
MRWKRARGPTMSSFTLRSSKCVRFFYSLFVDAWSINFGLFSAIALLTMIKARHTTYANVCVNKSYIYIWYKHIYSYSYSLLIKITRSWCGMLAWLLFHFIREKFFFINIHICTYKCWHLNLTSIYPYNKSLQLSSYICKWRFVRGENNIWRRGEVRTQQ